jgi:hypothetical protein
MSNQQPVKDLARALRTSARGDEAEQSSCLLEYLAWEELDVMSGWTGMVLRVLVLRYG